MTNGLPALDDPALFWRVTETSVKLMRREENPIPTPHVYWRFDSEGDYEPRGAEKPVRYRTWWGTRRERIETAEILHRVNTVIQEEREYDGMGLGVVLRVTRETVPVLAERALRKYHEDIERASLIGDYPPKTWEEEKA